VRKAGGVLHGVVEHVGDQVAVEQAFVNDLAIDFEPDVLGGQVSLLGKGDLGTEIADDDRADAGLFALAQQAVSGQRPAQALGRRLDGIARLAHVEPAFALGRGNQ